jgi:hypothetical protein
MQGEGGGARFTMSGIDPNRQYLRLSLWSAVMTYLGRYGGPIDNPNGLQSAPIVFLHEPQEIDGVSFLSHRKNDWKSQLTGNSSWGSCRNAEYWALRSGVVSDPLQPCELLGLSVLHASTR